VTDIVLPHVDFALDFHTGGAGIYNYPQSRVYGKDKRSLDLAEMFAMPYTVKTSLIQHSLRQTGYLKMIPMVVFEGGESLRIDDFAIREGMRGIKRAMGALKMIEDKHDRRTPVIFEASTWQRAAKSGIFTPRKQSGERIKKGDILGEIIDPNNSFISTVKAKYPGTIYGHNNSPVVSAGDALFHIGYTLAEHNRIVEAKTRKSKGKQR
jgi:predicted deacylase